MQSVAMRRLQLAELKDAAARLLESFEAAHGHPDSAQVLAIARSVAAAAGEVIAALGADVGAAGAAAGLTGKRPASCALVESRADAEAGDDGSAAASGPRAAKRRRLAGDAAGSGSALEAASSRDLAPCGRGADAGGAGAAAGAGAGALRGRGIGLAGRAGEAGGAGDADDSAGDDAGDAHAANGPALAGDGIRASASSRDAVRSAGAAGPSGLLPAPACGAAPRAGPPAGRSAGARSDRAADAAHAGAGAICVEEEAAADEKEAEEGPGTLACCVCGATAGGSSSNSACGGGQGACGCTDRDASAPVCPSSAQAADGGAGGRALLQLRCEHRVCACCLHDHVAARVAARDLPNGQLRCPRAGCATAVSDREIEVRGGVCCRGAAVGAGAVVDKGADPSQPESAQYTD